MLIRIVMVVLSLIGVLAFGDGVLAFVGSQSAVQETPSLLLVLIGVVGIGFAATIGVVLHVTYHVERGFAEAAIARREPERGQ
jgi:hypothetical protein